jgi:peptidoglycan hydrolase-like protein with peptidoglycan-binding domain
VTTAGDDTRRRRQRSFVAALVALLAVAAGCSGDRRDEEAATAAVVLPPIPVPATGPPPAAPPATAVTPPPAPPPAPPPELAVGARGLEVEALERRLTELRYDVVSLDGVYDANTRHAVVAFQKVNGLPRTGRATADVHAALAAAQPPAPLVPGGGPRRVEVDLPRQVLFLYHDDVLFRILPVSTGSGRRFCSEGRCRRAVTPAGAYRVGYRLDGWRRSPLGLLYNPLYFQVKVGLAIHGNPSVPASPASHGCVRIPMAASRWLPGEVPDGTPVYVLDGKTPVSPFPAV